MIKVENFEVKSLIEIIERMRWVLTEETEQTLVLISEKCVNDMKRIGIQPEQPSYTFQGNESANLVEKIRLFDFYELWMVRITTNVPISLYSIIAFKDKTNQIKNFNQKEINKQIIFDFK